MKVFNKDLKKKDVLTKFGDLSQLGGIKRYIMDSGITRGVRAIEMDNGNGLVIKVLEDRALDISEAKYKSIPIAWRSPTLETNPFFFDKDNFEFFKSFFGGLLTTCGLTYVGAPCKDENEELGLHGRISNIPANVNIINGFWEDDDYKMIVSGKVREVSVFGDKLELTRNIIMIMGQDKIFINDVVENIGSIKSPIMILYHINIGYPILDSGARLIESKAKVEARDDEARKEGENFGIFSEPIKGFKEKVYLHEIESDSKGFSNIGIVNEKFYKDKGIGVYIRFNKDNLPFLAEWKMMGIGEYVVGLSPANCSPRGRAFERKTGVLKFLKPGESLNYNIEIGILDSNDAISEFKKGL